MKNILFISSLFPNPMEPTYATFNWQQIAALTKYYAIDVIAPISWKRRLKNRIWFRNWTFNFDNALCNVYYPTYWNTPGVFRNNNGCLYWLSILSTVQRLHKQKEYSAIYSSWLFPDSWAAKKFANKLNLPLFVKVHGTDVNNLAAGSSITKKSLSVIAQAKKTFCVSQALRDKLVELGANGCSLEVVYNGINRNIFKPKRVNNSKTDNKTTFLYVGNLKKTKGLAELIESFSRLVRIYPKRSIQLIIVGDGPYKSELLNKISKCNLSKHVKFLGSLSMDKVSFWMNSSDCLCLPSYNEGLPNVVLEALSCQLPVVATSVGGIPELAQQSPGITLVSPKSVDSLFDGLESKLTKKEDLTLPSFIGSWEENAYTIAGLMKL